MKWLEEIVAPLDNLQGVVVTRLPDCTAWAVWQAISFDSDDVAAYFGDMMRANRKTCQAINPKVGEIGLSLLPKIR